MVRVIRPAMARPGEPFRFSRRSTIERRFLAEPPVDDLVTPDSLDPLDRRVYDMAVSRAPLAQIAVQLGLTVSQAEERIQRVCGRLGVTDRAALREWQPREAVETNHVEPASEPAQSPPAARRMSRRAFVAGAGGLVAASAIGTVAVWRSRDGSGSNGPGPAPSATAITPPALIGDEALVGERPFEETWEVARFAKGELIDWPHGLFLMGTVGGEVRAHRLKTGQVFQYSTWPGGRFVSAIDGNEVPTGHVMDILNTETSWSWPDQGLQLIAVAGALPQATLVFERRENNKGAGELTLFRVQQPGAGFEPLAAVAVPATGFTTPALVSPEGDAVAVVSAGSTRLIVTIFDAATGTVRATYDNGLSATTEGVGWGLDALQPLDGGESFLLAWHLYEQERGTWMRGFVMTCRWDGRGATDPVTHDNGASFSTDGRLYLREVPLRNVGPASADGPREYWPAVEIVETGTGKSLGRVRSAAIYYGDWAPPRRWRATAAFAAFVRTTQGENGYDFGTISTRTASGAWALTERYPFEPDPALDGTWFQSPWKQGVVPSPGDPELVALGRWAVLNTREGQLVKANTRTESGPAHIDPWAAGRGWLTFAFPHLGHGGGSEPVLLQPKIEPASAPVESPLRFQVSAAGDRLNLRDQPSLAGKIIAALEDGSMLTQAESPERPAGRRGLEQGEDGTWVFVRTPGGLEGWVNSAYLAWP